jgi:hypothetical protein
MFNIYPGLLSEERQQELAQELHDANLYRQYYIHATKEPRAHFLLHKRATTTDENFDTSLQPGTKPCTFVQNPRYVLLTLSALHVLLQGTRMEEPH